MQLVSEERVEKLIGGRLRILYQKPSNRTRNECLDISIYSMACKELLRVCFSIRPETYHAKPGTQLVHKPRERSPILKMPKFEGAF